jgi:hypothetical protein
MKTIQAAQSLKRKFGGHLTKDGCTTNTILVEAEISDHEADGFFVAKQKAFSSVSCLCCKRPDPLEARQRFLNQEDESEFVKGREISWE